MVCDMLDYMVGQIDLDHMVFRTEKAFSDIKIIKLWFFMEILISDDQQDSNFDFVQ